jgi:hypothetical protein
MGQDQSLVSFSYYSLYPEYPNDPRLLELAREEILERMRISLYESRDAFNYKIIGDVSEEFPNPRHLGVTSFIKSRLIRDMLFQITYDVLIANYYYYSPPVDEYQNIDLISLATNFADYLADNFIVANVKLSNILRFFYEERSRVRTDNKAWWKIKDDTKGNPPPHYEGHIPPPIEVHNNFKKYLKYKKKYLELLKK